MFIYLNAENDVVARSNNAFDVGTLDPSLIAVLRIDNAPETVRCKSASESRGTTWHRHESAIGDGSDIAHYSEQGGLVLARKKKMASFKPRTEELIAVGFVYGGKRFSLDKDARDKMMGLNQIRNEAIGYPVRWNTIDGADALNLVDAADVLGFYLAGVGAVRAAEDSETALKDLCRAAVDEAGVAAISDTR